MSNVLNRDLVVPLAKLEAVVRSMIVHESAKVLGFSSMDELTNDEIINLRFVSIRIGMLQQSLARGVITRPVAFEAICECRLHCEAFEEVEITTLEQFFEADPLLIKFALNHAERMGAPKQYHLYSLLHEDAKAYGDNLQKLPFEYHEPLRMRHGIARR